MKIIPVLLFCHPLYTEDVRIRNLFSQEPNFCYLRKLQQKVYFSKQSIENLYNQAALAITGC